MKEILRTENLTAGYDKPILEELNISVNEGEIVVLIGPNGAGKTTFLKTVSGVLDPLYGNVIIDGKHIDTLKRLERAKRIAAVFTEKTYADYTCEEMVSMGRYPYTNGIGSLGDEDRKTISEAMELTSVSDIKERSFQKISDGQKQRVLLARAIAQKPSLLILDEPTSFLDVKYKMDFLKLLGNLSKEKNFSVLMSLHELDMARQIADRIVCLKGKRIDKIGSVDDIFSGGYIKELFGITSGDFDEKTGLGIIDGI